MIFLVSRIDSASVSEKKGNAPDSREGDNRVNNAAENVGGSAEYPCNQVKLEKTNESPVQRADDYKNKTKFIKHKNHSFSAKLVCAKIEVFMQIFILIYLKNLFFSYYALK